VGDDKRHKSLDVTSHWNSFDFSNVSLVTLYSLWMSGMLQVNLCSFFSVHLSRM